MKLSVVVITKNEERNIAACLESVQWADEIVVVDAQSDDHTVDLAKRFTPFVLVRPWPGYGPQKNFAIAQTHGMWVLVLDADERVLPPLRQEICELLQHRDGEGIAGYEIPRRNYFYGRWIQGGGVFPDYQLRLFRRGRGAYDDTALHERLVVQGTVGRLTHALSHDTAPTIRSHVSKTYRYSTLGAQEKLKTTDRVTAWKMVAHPIGALFKTYLLRKGFRDGLHGLLLAGFTGMYTFLKYAKAWEVLLSRNAAGARQGEAGATRH